MKRTVYITAWIVLGLLLSFVAHAVMEIGYIKYALGSGVVLTNHMVFGGGYCALPAWLQYLLFALGIVGGYLAGKFFWRVIYIEKRYRRLKG